MRNFHVNSIICVSALVFAASATQSAAQTANETENTTPILLGTIIIYGGSDDEVVDAEEIVIQQPTTLNELLSRSPDVSVSGGNRTPAQRVYVRGVDDARLTSTINGARTSGVIFPHNGSNGIDPFLLERVEIEAGTGNALSGPATLGGAIRYETRDAEDLLLPGQTFGGLLRFSGQTNGDQLTYGAAIYGRPDERFSYVLYYSDTFADNYEDGDGNEVTFSDNEPSTAMIDLDFRPAEGHELSFTSIRREDNGLRSFQANFGVNPILPPATPEDQELIQMTNVLSYRFNPADNPMIDLQARIYENETELVRRPTFPFPSTITGTWRTRGIELRNTSDFDRFSLTYGVDYTEEFSLGEVAGGPSASETSRTFGAFVQGDFDISDQLFVTAGLRFDAASLTDIAGNEYEGGHISPNIGFRYTPTDDLAFFASWSQAYAGVQPAPGFNLIRGINTAVNDPTLDGEVANTFEVGVDYERDGLFLGATLFQTTIDDVILYDGRGGAPYARTNGGEAETRGYTLRAGYAWSDWDVGLIFAHQETTLGGRSVSPDDWYDGFVPQGDTLDFTIGYQHPRQDLRVEWHSKFVFSEDDLPATFTSASELAAYDVHDLSVVWRPSLNQEYALAVTNIFDESYVAHGTPFNVPGGVTNLREPGRSIRLTASFRF